MTLVSSVLVKAAGVIAGICEVVANVPLVGNVTFVAPVMVNALAKAPTVDKFPPKVRVLDPLLIPVPPDALPNGMELSVNPAKVGVLPKAISCGNEAVMFPVGELKLIWFVVPVND